MPAGICCAKANSNHGLIWSAAESMISSGTARRSVSVKKPCEGKSSRSERKPCAMLGTAWLPVTGGLDSL